MFDAADAYDRFIGRYAPELASALCDFAGVRAGESALDVGAGTGLLTAELAARLGADRVVAVEPSPPFAGATRARVPEVEVHVVAAEHLPFGGGTFDHALAQLVVNFLTDPLAGVTAMAGAARTVTAAVWDYAGEMTLLRAFWDAAVALEPDAPDEGRTMAYCTPGALEALWREAGLRDVEVAPLVVTASYTGFDDLWAPLLTGVGPAGAHVAALADPAPLADELRRRLAVGDAPFTLSARAWAVRGTR